MRRSVLPLLLASSLALSGCAASIAAGVVGAAVRAGNAGREADPHIDLRVPAIQECSARASQHGRVHIIDSEQGSRGVTVWGTVQNESERRSFECRYNRGIAGFTLRAIPSR